MVLFNLMTLASFGVGVLIFALFTLLFKGDFMQGFGLLLAGIWTVVVDIRIRKKNQIEATWLFSPKYGGHLTFIPAWVCGIPFLFVGLLTMTGVMNLR